MREKLLANLDRADGAALLHYFDALVKDDQGPPGFSGQVCIAVRGRAGYRFWEGRFSRTAETGFCDAVPDTAGVTLFLSAHEADAILTTGTLPERRELLMIDGDPRLMKKFIGRYTGTTNWLGIRMH